MKWFPLGFSVLLLCGKLLVCGTACLAGDGDTSEIFVLPGETLNLEQREGDSFEAALGGGALTAVGSSIVCPREGSHLLALISRDRAGNVSPVRWVWLTVDGQEPSLEARWVPEPVEGAESKKWISPQTKVFFNARDDGSGVANMTLAVNGNEVSGTGAELTRVLADETVFRIKLSARDKVGNQADKEEALLFLDEEPPRGSLSLAGAWVSLDGRIIAAPEARLVWEISDDHSGLEGWAPKNKGTEMERSSLNGPWPAGDHRVSLEAWDRVGNRGLLGPLSFTVDDTAPEIQWRIVDEGILNPSGEMVYKPPVALEISARDDLAGVTRLAWSTDGGEWQKVSGPLSSSAQSLLIKAGDGVGNEKQQQIHWILDQAPPQVSLLEPVLAESSPTDNFSLRVGDRVKIAVRDAGSGIGSAFFRLNSQKWESLPDTIQFQSIGKFTLEVSATDKLGNRTRRIWRVVVKYAKSK